MASPALTVPDEILEYIFLRLDAPADLARASAACTTFRRVITARAFLRRIRSLLPLPALGLLEPFVAGRGFLPAEPPHCSASAARAVAQAADFAFSFIPGLGRGRWRICDVRDGRALLSIPDVNAGFFDDLVVCDPLHRRYVRIPRVPDDLAGPVRRGYQHRSRLPGTPAFEYFLAPAGEDEEEEDEGRSISFQVLCRAGVPNENRVDIFVFSSGTGSWRVITFDGCAATVKLLWRQYAHGCFYWFTTFRDKSLMLDTHKMELSIVAGFPQGWESLNDKAIVEAGKGRLGLFTFGGTLGVCLNLYSKSIGGSDDEEWRHDKIIPLLPGYGWQIFVPTKGYLLLEGVPLDYFRSSLSHVPPETQYFTLELKTLLLERLCASSYHILGDFPLLYTSWPPPLSLPSI